MGDSKDLGGRVRRLENIAWVLGALAVIFGIAGPFGFLMLDSARERLGELETELETTEERLEEARVQQEARLQREAERLSSDLQARADEIATQFFHRCSQFETVQVGRSRDSVWKRVEVTYPRPFERPPTLLVTPRSENYHDAFAATIVTASETSFVAEVRRVDGGDGRWRQNLRLNWLAINSQAAD